MLSFFVLMTVVAARDQQSENATAAVCPPASSNSGGGCYAHMTQTGAYRLRILNPTLSSALRQDSPFSVATSSGGSTFHARYMVLILIRSASQWNYPCYLLHASYLSICMFHASFGSIANCCLAENYDVVSAAIATTYSGVFISYGGPLGSASTWALAYYVYMQNLPVSHLEDHPFSEFGERFCGYTHVYGQTLQSQWIVTFAINNPTLASRDRNPYNYGWQSFLPHYTTALVKQSAVRFAYYENMTVVFAVAASSNLQALLISLPSALLGRSWDVTGTSMAVVKIFGIALAYIMTQKLIRTQVYMTVHEAPFCSSGCPVLDSGATDPLPLSQSISYAVHSKRRSSVAPFVFTVVGPESSTTIIKFLCGAGPLSLWTGAGINFCPFDNVDICTSITRVAALSGSLQVSEEAETLHNLQRSYQIWLPENQIYSPVCADPIQLDLLGADCAAANYCDLFVVILPSIKAQIPFTSDTFYAVIALLSLAATKLSEHFALSFLPAALFRIPYYKHLDQWFPNYSFFSAGKGGFGFTKESGNPLMDYMTYLVERVGAHFTAEGQTSNFICSYSQFLNTLSQNVPQTDFIKEQLEHGY